jgi:hypothetical protein
MTELPRPTSQVEHVTVRGQAIAVRFWPLTPAEMATTGRLAKKATLASGATLDTVSSDEESSLQWATRLLFLGTRQPDDAREPFFRSTEELADILTESEVESALRAYSAFRIECGPSITSLTPEEMGAWIEHLRLGATAAPFDVIRWGSSDKPHAVPGVEPEHFCDCHFLSWVAARRAAYPDS